MGWENRGPSAARGRRVAKDFSYLIFVLAIQTPKPQSLRFPKLENSRRNDLIAEALKKGNLDLKQFLTIYFKITALKTLKLRFLTQILIFAVKVSFCQKISNGTVIDVLFDSRL